MSIVLALLLATGTTVAPAPAEDKPANKPFELGSISLLQPQELLEQRVSGTGLTPTIQAIVSSARAWSLEVPGGDACVIHVAIRPAHRFRTWAVCQSADAAALDCHIANDVAVADIAEVTDGTVVFSIQGKAPLGGRNDGCVPLPEGLAGRRRQGIDRNDHPRRPRLEGLTAAHGSDPGCTQCGHLNPAPANYDAPDA